MEKIKLNEPGSVKLGRYRSHVSKQAQHPKLYFDLYFDLVQA